MTSSVKVEFIQGSTCAITGTSITTLVCEYPRAIHAQLLTHRVFSKNSSSTRAVPIKTAIKQVKANPAKYIWTKNQSGMQGEVITDPNELFKINAAYELALLNACEFVKVLGDKEEDGGLNVHKQNAGRLLEPFQNIRICLTSTEWDNWDWLRIDADAQGEIAELAQAMKQAREDNASKYLVLNNGEWHVPFIHRAECQKTGKLQYFHPETSKELTLEQAKELSMSICAQTSYRKEDYSDEKTSTVIDRLFTGNKVHASPSEHQATPIHNNSNMLGFVRTDGKYLAYFDTSSWPEGVTHVDRNATYWSGNFKHWIQNRQLIPNHDYAKRT
jgi:hypothetical protein